MGFTLPAAPSVRLHGAIVRIARLASLAVVLYANAANCHAATALQDTLGKQVEACTACHGEQGKAGPDGYYPRLAGKPADYLYNQLVNFKEGRRHYALMIGLLEPLNDAYLREIASYFSKLDIPYAAPLSGRTPSAVLARGERLVKEGDAAQKIPACTQCHGTALTGVLPSTPGLLGLSNDYLSAQLGAWKAGRRHARAPDCMRTIAQSLSDSDANAVSRWLSAQKPPISSAAIARTAHRPANVQDIPCGSTQEVPAPAPALATDTLLSRGAYLARIGNCAQCHTARGGKTYAGGRGIPTPFGTIYAGNITPDPQTGIGRWSAPDFWQALHHGKSKDGRLLYPAFPYTNFTHVTRDDSDALFAYLQSIPAVKQANTPHALRWPYSTQTALAAWRFVNFTPATPTRAPEGTDPSVLLNRGAYLVNGLGHCSACHSPRNAMGAVSERTALGGGMIPQTRWYAPSLRAANEAGVSEWSDEDVTALLTIGISERGHASGPMAEVVANSTQYLSPSDARAMSAYLRSLAPSTVSAPKATPVTAVRLPSASQGADLYAQHCAQCHGKQGQGEKGVYPPLAQSRMVNLDNPSNAVQMVVYGGYAPATHGNPRPFGMPPFQLKLNDRQIALLLNFIRASWGNSGRPVSALEVHQMSGGPAD